MGNCRSFESRSTVTAKLILLDGKLQEFSWPVRVSYLLELNSDCFICSSEEMEFDEFAAEISCDEVLQPGEIYFQLPLGWRNHRLQAEDMAVLASKASVALAGKYGRDVDNYQMISCCCCRWRHVEPAALFCEKERPLLASIGGGVCAERSRRDGGAGGRKRAKFVANLSSIVEE